MVEGFVTIFSKNNSLFTRKAKLITIVSPFSYGIKYQGNLNLYTQKNQMKEKSFTEYLKKNV